MRGTLTLFLLVMMSGMVAANAYRGFLLTKDEIHLTGYVNFIQYRASGLVIQFTNDFGDQYIIEPNRVAGFGFSTDEGVLQYVSRFHQGQWLFFRVVETGRKLHLYRVPDNRSQWVDGASYRNLVFELPDFWVEHRRNRTLTPIYRSGFRRTMRSLLTDLPVLADSIGKRGFRYRNLPEIIQQYNLQAKRANRRL